MYHHMEGNGQAFASNLDIDAALFDVSNRMARAQLARQLSNSSTASRQMASRIYKINSAGTSPQNIQRRRTTASHRACRHRSDVYMYTTPLSQDGTAAYNAQGRSVHTTRPMSWHPSSMGYNRSTAPVSQRTELPRHSISDYPPPPFDHLSFPSITAGPPAEVPNDVYFHHHVGTTEYQHTTTGFGDYGLAGPSLDIAYPDFVPFENGSHSQYQSLATLDAMPPCSAVNFSTQAWADSLGTFPIYTAPPTPDFLPIQSHSDGWPVEEVDRLLTLPKKSSKELIGMGLYDKPDRNSFSLDSITDSHPGSLVVDPHRDSMGKGLKLEETWEPPEDEKSSDEDDGPAGDHNDLGEDVSAPVSTITPSHPPEALFPTYGDLSNQSFFFEADETYVDGVSFGRPMLDMASNLSGGNPVTYDWT